MTPTEEAACRALEAIQLDKTIPRAKRRLWQKLLIEAAGIVQLPIRGRGREQTIDKDRINELLKNPEGLPLVKLYESIAGECGCSASYVAKVAKGLR